MLYNNSSIIHSSHRAMDRHLQKGRPENSRINMADLFGHFSLDIINFIFHKLGDKIGMGGRNETCLDHPWGELIFRHHPTVSLTWKGGMRETFRIGFVLEEALGTAQSVMGEMRWRLRFNTRRFLHTRSNDLDLISYAATDDRAKVKDSRKRGQTDEKPL